MAAAWISTQGELTVYILYVLLLINLGKDVDEDVRGSYPTVEACWAEATRIARSPEVFSVRCALEQN